MATDASTPARRPKTRLLRVLLTVAAVIVGYLVWQPWPRPSFSGSEKGLFKAHVDNTYVCGDVVVRDDAGRWPVQVTKMSLSTNDDVEAMLFAVSPSSPYYIVGAGVYDRWPDLDQPEEVTAGFELGRGQRVPPYRVLVAVKPQSQGNVGRFTATMTYKYRWLPARSAKVDFACALDVTRTGPDPRAEQVGQ